MSSNIHLADMYLAINSRYNMLGEHEHYSTHNSSVKTIQNYKTVVPVTNVAAVDIDYVDNMQMESMSKLQQRQQQQQCK